MTLMFMAYCVLVYCRRSCYCLPGPVMYQIATPLGIHGLVYRLIISGISKSTVTDGYDCNCCNRICRGWMATCAWRK